MGTYKKKMYAAAQRLGKLYGLNLVSVDDIQNIQSNAVVDTGVLETLEENSVPLLSKEHVVLNDILINTTDGALFAKDIVEKLKEIDSEKATNLLRVFYAGENVPGTSEQLNESDQASWRPNIINLISNSEINSDIAQNANSPSKENPSLALLMSNSPRVSLEGRNIDPAVIFLNGIPNIELQRAVPFVNVQFFIPRPPTTGDAGEGRIQALSLLKFLNGADTVDIGPADILTKSTKVPSNKFTQPLPDDPPEFYTQAGMELFTAPQTLVNANTEDDQTKFSAPVLDKFRPFLTIRDLSLSIVGTRGLMCYKSGKMRLVLHDRSRLAQIADFLRAELYGRQQIMIEYGWSHPDGNRINGDSNPYGDLINGMRVKEKYRVINSSFSFEDSGEVSITLEIAAEGASSFNTELVSSKFGEETPGKMLQQIQELQEVVEELSSRFNPEQDKVKSKKIHGAQFLEVASDAIHHMSLDGESKKELRKLRRALRNDDHPDADRLLNALNNLYTEENEDGLVKKYKKTVAQSITEKVRALDVKDDPFLTGKVSGARNAIRKKHVKRAIDRQLEREGFQMTDISSGKACSLGKLLLLFIGEPLANTFNYDEVQIITYGFNDYAGTAHGLNISEFAVNLEFFAQELFRYRMEHISKSGNMTVNEFLQFLADIILDDPAAPSYGLLDGEGKFYKEVLDEEKNLKIQSTAANSVEMERRIEKRMKELGLPKWQAPVIEFYVETLAQELVLEDGQDSERESGESILRIHVYDKTASRYSTIENLMQSTREGQIAAINSKPPGSESGGNETAEKEKEEMAKLLLERATEASSGQESLLQKIPDPKDSNSFIYRITGGPRQLKDYYMRTTPYIIYGSQGSTIKNAQLASQHNSQLATINLLRTHQKSELEPNGENPGGLPLQIIPTELNISCHGCPLIDFTQAFFVDFQTNTSADALYRVVGVEHKFSPGEFTTDVKFVPSEGYGQYYSLVDRISKAAAIIDKDQNGEEG